MKKTACVVLPTYNEAQNVRILIPRLFALAPSITSHELHLLVVDDGSPDGTQDVVAGLMEHYPNLHLLTGEKRGLGVAYQRGMAFALSELRADLIFQMDADLQHPAELVPLFVTLALFGYSLVIGSRFAPGGSTPDFSLRRRLMSRFGNWLIRFLGGIPRLHDCTSGFRCIRADLIRRCDLSSLSTRGYSFQSSLLCELLQNGARPIEVPMVFASRVHGTSKLSLRDQVEFLVNIFRIRLRRSQELFKFLAVGGSGVLVNMAILLLLTRLGGLRLEIASPIAIETSILTNFALNSLWTFRRRRAGGTTAGRLLRFHLVSAAAGLVNYGLLLVLVRRAGVWDVAANLAGIALATFVNYGLNSLWTWKRQPPVAVVPAAEPIASAPPVEPPVSATP